VALPVQYRRTASFLQPRPLRISLLFATAIVLAISCVTIASAQAGSPNFPGSPHFAPVAPPTGIVAPRTGSVTPPTGTVPLANRSNGIVPSSPRFGPNNPNPHQHPHHDPNGIVYYPYPYAVPVPYAAYTGQPDSADNAASPDDQADSNALDPTEANADPYSEPPYEGPMRLQDAQEQDSALDESGSVDPADPAQPTTILVFKDGHQLEVENYAIVGQTLYDLTPGHARKVPLADLDLPSTEKQNDDRGVVFQLPSGQGS
jgi:hypothetical protein